MQAILMAGGKGTRLRPFTAILPKPLVPVGEISIMEMLLRQLRYYGFERIKISVGHKAELIMAVIGDGRRYGLDVTYHNEENPLGTVGALADMEDLDDNFLVMNGDVCTNLNFREIYERHVATGGIATIGSYPRSEQIELGVLELNEAGEKIIGFREKPTYDFFVAMGVNAFHKSVTKLIPSGEYFGFDMLVHKMLDNKIPIHTHRFNGVWFDIGRPDDYNKMLEDFHANPQVYLPKGS